MKRNKHEPWEISYDNYLGQKSYDPEKKEGTFLSALNSWIDNHTTAYCVAILIAMVCVGAYALICSYNSDEAQDTVQFSVDDISYDSQEQQISTDPIPGICYPEDDPAYQGKSSKTGGPNTETDSGIHNGMYQYRTENGEIVTVFNPPSELGPIPVTTDTTITDQTTGETTWIVDDPINGSRD